MEYVERFRLLYTRNLYFVFSTWLALWADLCLRVTDSGLRFRAKNGLPGVLYALAVTTVVYFSEITLHITRISIGLSDKAGAIYTDLLNANAPDALFLLIFSFTGYVIVFVPVMFAGAKVIGVGESEDPVSDHSQING